MIHGYLKPNDLRQETEKGSDKSFIAFYQTVYTLTGTPDYYSFYYRISIHNHELAAFFIVNFLIALVDDSNQIARTVPKDPDFLDFFKYIFKVRYILIINI